MDLLSFKHIITGTFTPKSIHNTLLGIIFLLFKIRSLINFFNFLLIYIPPLINCHSLTPSPATLSCFLTMPKSHMEISLSKLNLHKKKKVFYWFLHRYWNMIGYFLKKTLILLEILKVFLPFRRTIENCYIL